ncbi:ABC transporter [Halorubrum distributum JCM 9100]|uniref:Cobalamin import ATP-binding protein BtuD n=5 Tax=Halorubrum distributum TaxID=29283 RepID=M0ERD7_9EURY|nr:MULTISPECIES: ABC transporter ATP-binding protein [Halorubrum distributum group]ELZ50371.1 ABC transporter [Halorubrum distributum JCM 9100]ELZ54474.1 ABC transporter [Halorubrum distributum JCM 10118]EMA62204.1 ABC transporter [Halorubrum litoreum JCM 13561]EMA71447.1 ABC transporter [Halorubrum arcis JCM 13916]MDV7350074.1 ABC transporter ATP-binding protein [Halorubrum distributum]
MTIFGANATESEEQSGATEPNGAAEPTGGNGPRGAAEPSGAGGATDASDLDAEDLVLGYPTAPEPVIDGESIAAEPGAVTALVGPNGSGKSTLLKGLADQIEPDDGSVLLDGRDVRSLDTKALAKQLGLLSQESTSPDSITVEDLVYHGRYPHRGFFERTTAEDARAVERAIDLAGCGHLRDREVGSLSGGQKQLAWIAMVLAQDTDVLLLDEPTTFLDLHHQMEVMEIIETLRDESDVTVVVVLHDIEQAARLADRVVALADGEIRASGPPEAVVTEELLSDVFRVDAEVVDTDRGPRVTPIRARHEE